ncbi:MAG: hypothetical protein IT281_05360 [Ignavibacteria bacterium]|nr:hypothetical protein [Ignavibacteria bacterium]MCC7158946.1 hypothetical protein [Ignavibacteria bacterium]
MAADKQIIIDALNTAIAGGGAVVFAIGDHFVQAAATAPGEIVAEAVSHHFHSGIDIGLESSFAAMGFGLEEGGNYGRKYSTGDAASVEKIADDFMRIFDELYHADINLPFEVSDV